MLKILAAATLAALFVAPASAQSTKSEGSEAAALRSYAASDTQKTNKKTKKKVATTYAKPMRPWTYSTNPEHDVYVNGEYVGSDPDPRIRWTLRAEAKKNVGVRN